MFVDMLKLGEHWLRKFFYYLILMISQSYLGMSFERSAHVVMIRLVGKVVSCADSVWMPRQARRGHARDFSLLPEYSILRRAEVIQFKRRYASILRDISLLNKHICNRQCPDFIRLSILILGPGYPQHYHVHISIQLRVSHFNWDLYYRQYPIKAKSFFHTWIPRVSKDYLFC